MVDTRLDAYEVLNVPLDVSDEDLRRAYQRLAREFHPDKGGSQAEASFVRVQQAWDQLREPSLRRRYDAQLRVEKMAEAQSRAHVTDIELDEMDHEDVCSGHSWSYACRCGDRYFVDEAQLDEGICLIECNSCSLAIHVSRTF